MPVAVVQVGHVGMRVPHRLVYVLVGVGLGTFVAMVCVLVVFIVYMAVCVHEPPMLVLVRVQFGQHEPGRERHQSGGDDETGRDRLAEKRHGERRADEGSGAEMGAGPGGAKVAQRVYE
jgi:hypothetical protein